MMWKIGIRVLLVLFIIWLIYFIINFISPKTFDFLRNKKPVNTTENFTQEQNIPFRYRIYNMFFKSRSLPPEPIEAKNSSSTNDGPRIIGNNIRDKNKLREDDLYIYPNSRKNNVAKNFRFDDILIKETGKNVLKDNTKITGQITREYLSSLYFMIDIYDKDGNFLYSFPANGSFNTKDDRIFDFSAINKNIYNYYDYKGDGFMVIWSDNPVVESVLIINIILE